MKAHKKTKLFRHFMTILNMLALAVPMVVLGFHALNDSLPKFFASQSVQHHGGESDVFSDDLDYANEQLKTRSLDDNLMLTMDSMNYMNYGESVVNTEISYRFETNEVTTRDDIVIGNIYELRFTYNNINTFTATSLGNFALYGFKYNNYSTYSSAANTSLFNWTNNNSFLVQVESTSSRGRFIFSNNYGNMSITGNGASMSLFLVPTDDTFIFNNDLITYSSCSKQYIPYTIVSVDYNYTLSGIDDWKTYYNNKNYAQIIDTGVSTHLPINVDFVSLFTQSDIINHDGNIATLLFINFYCNWILNISLIIFFPQVIMCFINWAIDLIYKFTEVKGD